MFKQILVLGFLVLLAANSAFAKAFCACCAEPGTYMISTGKPQQYQLDLLKEVEFDNAAMLYMTEAGFDAIKGLSSIEKEFDDASWVASPGGLGLVQSFTGKTWNFDIKSPKGKPGRLSLPVPTQMVTYKVDIHDGQGGGNGPLLYKEFRFKGTVTSGTGFFSAGMAKPTTYFLVFQGRGNGCDNAEDFNNWNLEITGPKADYQFFGKLKSGNGSGVQEAPKLVN